MEQHTTPTHEGVTPPDDGGWAYHDLVIAPSPSPFDLLSLRSSSNVNTVVWRTCEVAEGLATPPLAFSRWLDLVTSSGFGAWVDVGDLLTNSALEQLLGDLTAHEARVVDGGAAPWRTVRLGSASSSYFSRPALFLRLNIPWSRITEGEDVVELISRIRMSIESIGSVVPSAIISISCDGVMTPAVAELVLAAIDGFVEHGVAFSFEIQLSQLAQSGTLPLLHRLLGAGPHTSVTLCVDPLPPLKGTPIAPVNSELIVRAVEALSAHRIIYTAGCQAELERMKREDITVSAHSAARDVPLFVVLVGASALGAALAVLLLLSVGHRKK